MRKFRQAAVVAAALGSLGMVGAGVASAGGWEHTQLPNITCEQSNGDTSGDVDVPALTDLVGGGGSADSRNEQNNCGVGIIGNDQSSGDANGGDATGAA